MNTVQDIKNAIQQLPSMDRQRLEHWFYGELSLKYQIGAANRESLQVRDPGAVYATDPDHFYMSIDEYREFEERSPARHEYVAGEVFAMTGASLYHNRVAGRLHYAIAHHLRRRPCEAFINDLRLYIRIEDFEYCYYPDLMVICGLGSENLKEIQQPKLAIEVLSPSTQNSERREKVVNYQHVSTMEEFALISQHRPEIAIYRRSEQWRPQVISGPEAVAEFRSIGLSVPLGPIFDGMG